MPNKNVTITMSMDMFEFMKEMADKYAQGNKSRLIRMVLRYYQEDVRAH